MASGIFRRLFLTNVAIVMGVLLTVAISATLYSNWYYQSQEQKQLEKQGKVVCGQIAAYLQGETDAGQLQQVVDALAQTSATRIVALEARPETAAQLKNKLGQVKSEQDISRMYARVLQGEQVIEHRSFFFPYHTSVMLVAQPVLYQGAVKVVVFLYTPLQESADTIKGIYRIIWGTAAGALIVAALLVYAVSRKMSQPVSAMAAGARALARGEIVPDFPIIDNNEIGDLAAAFNHMKMELAKTEQIRRDLITDVSHELRTPLTSVRGFIQAILDGVVAPQQEKKYLSLAYQELQRVTALVQDLLDLSRLQAGTTRITHQPVELGQIAARAISTLTIQAYSNEIQVNLLSAEPIFVKGDGDRLEQVVLNLLHNAINYSPVASTVQVKVAKDGSEALLAVCDNGPGINAEDIPYIFDRFRRGTGSGGEGTGVGLAIVRALVEVHKGRLEVISNPQQGTEIQVWLPLLTDV